MSDTRPTAQGVLELHPKGGYGFLRNPAKHYTPTPGDAYVSSALIAQFKLAEGVHVAGPVDPPKKGNTGPRLAAVTQIEGGDPAAFKRRKWDELTPVDPTKWIKLETGAEPLTTRVMDLFTPIGMGQRGLIVAPPRTGKTVLLSHIAAAVTANHPTMHLMVLLVDERPEEVTEMKRGVKGEVIASSSDNDTSNHIRVAQLVLERAKRLVEQGRDAFVLLDSLTRLARAYNKQTGTGRTMSGGVDAKALDVPKRLFGSARAFEEGGTLTILGTALIETGSRMDEVIFEEFKGTGNSEIVLDRKVADKRVFPAMDILKSGTRKEDLLVDQKDLQKTYVLRRILNPMGTTDAIEFLLSKLKQTKTNGEFFESMNA